jgi:sulfatase maturation enzyme AslB (radical SAM superfamily)
MTSTVSQGDTPQDIVSARLRNRLRVLGHLDRIHEITTLMQDVKRDNARVAPALVELHVTDRCDLDCVFCTYDDRKTESFPWDGLAAIAQLEPRAVVLAGGGEPTLYRSGDRRIQDVIHELSGLLPSTRVGLVSNGAVYPGDDAAKKLAWARVSIDSGSELIHDLTKRVLRGSYGRRIANIMSYIRAGVPEVGVGFVYHKYNLHEAAAFIDGFYALWKDLPATVGAVNLQFRPTCGIQSCDCPSSNYSKDGRLMTPDLTEEWRKERDTQRDLVAQHMREDPLFESFVQQRTNFLTGELQGPISKVGPFDRCYLSLVRMIVRANGDAFPCVMKASHRHAPIGNVLTSSTTELLNGIAAYYRLEPDRCRGQADCCNIDGVKNVYLMEALSEPTRSPTSENDWHNDPFF